MMPINYECSQDDTSLVEFMNRRFDPDVLATRNRDTRTAHRRAVARLRLYLNREAMLSDLNETTRDGFEGWLVENGFAVKSGFDGVNCFVRIWRHAYHVGAVQKGPKKRSTKRDLAKEFLLAPVGLRQGKPARLEDFVRQYALQRGLEIDSVRALRNRLKSFGASLGRRPRFSDLRHELVNAWLAQLLNNGVKPATVRGHRVAIVTIWNAAWQADLVAERPDRVARIKVPQRIPVAWSQAELARLLEVVDELGEERFRSGVQIRAFWRAIILTAYYSGLRKSDLYRLEYNSIGEDGRFFIVQHKTNNLVKCRLPADALLAIRQTMPPIRRYVFDGALSKARVTRELRVLLKKAKLRGSFKTLRATGATWCEAQNIGSAPAFLGHRSPEMARKHYIDPRFIPDVVVGPPPIGQELKREGGVA